jgi:hypothetical protein
VRNLLPRSPFRLFCTQTCNRTAHRGRTSHPLQGARAPAAETCPAFRRANTPHVSDATAVRMQPDGLLRSFPSVRHRRTFRIGMCISVARMIAQDLFQASGSVRRRVGGGGPPDAARNCGLIRGTNRMDRKLNLASSRTLGHFGVQRCISRKFIEVWCLRRLCRTWKRRVPRPESEITKVKVLN